MLHELLISTRPKQWYKNLVLFIGIIFSLNFFNLHMWVLSISAFLTFCMISGSEYIINDIIDKEKDRIHPRKRNRPIASEKLKVSYALSFAIILLIFAFTIASQINIQFLRISLAYFFLIIYYSLYLKHIAIVDVITISIGFVLRAVAGCIAIKVSISPWLIICAFLVALFLAIGKRRHELILLENDANNHRQVFDGFSPEMLEQMATIVMASLIMSYSLYTFLADNILMMVTIPIVVYGLFRYLFLVNSRNMGGEPEVMFKDREIVTCIVLWAVVAIGALVI
ncbi:Conserved membrane protein, possible 4-hydroxybenzoate octaprenyltransferase [Methanosarcina siciliae C2J]|uniref:Conserved membrane protein, possible 4-hydroxybenzoate octaprenyltransferase n=1 Tax=Methanosarcina siciliae C2J TaxID=1434118 RepID=A0A0E3PNB4_9EURY|nr:decaprenyl-phosphate phosphoribosyltransferase [Methanosarcina siciliae]AKB36544.1 Conserved membrane protein, possible 4-hydroxybenzoate octaprenyltransferase [Methanosarcina siciliae C2J]